MEWIPIVLVTFKVLVLGTGMFYAIKWHYDQGKKTMDKRAVLRTSSMVAVAFVLLAVGLMIGTFFVARMLGLDLTSS